MQKDNIDQILVKHTKADEIRKLCKQIELMKLKGIHSNRSQS